MARLVERPVRTLQFDFKSLRPMRILVVGATGAIGRGTVPLLIRAGHHVTAVGRSLERLRQLANCGASTVAIDLFDRDAVRRAIKGKDAVINVATQIPRPGLDMFLPGAWKETDRIREHGSALLVDEALAAGARVFVQESFAPIYEDDGDRWITEDAPTRPAHHSLSTLKAEASVHRFVRGGGRGVVLRFAYLYGPGDRFTDDVFRYAARGWLPILGPPGAYFPTLHHDDAASAVVVALSLPSGTYNVDDNEPMTHHQLSDALAAMLDVPAPKAPPEWLTTLAGGLGETMARSLRISNEKLRQQGGWSPTYATSREGWEAVHQAFVESSSASRRA
jgi:nucleoside-diphosphate-sugar epimerase